MRNEEELKKYFQNYVFDLYGTLIDIHTDENNLLFWTKMAALLSCYGADYTPEQMQQKYFDLVHQQERKLAFEKKLNFPEIRIEYVFAKLIKQAPKYHETREQITNCQEEEIAEGEWVRMFSHVFRTLSRTKLAIYPHTAATLEELRRNGSHIFLLSNAQKQFTDAEIEITGIRKYMEAVYISSDMGMKKPQPEFLQQLLEEQKLNPSETVMVGNDFQSDIGSAAACGIHGIFLNTDKLSSTEMRARISRLPLKPDGSRCRPDIIASGDIQELLCMAEMAK